MQYSILVVNCTITWTEKSTVILLHHNIALHWLATALLGRIETDESRWRRFFNLPQNRKNSNFKKMTFHGNFIIILIINTANVRCLQRVFYFFIIFILFFIDIRQCLASFGWQHIWQLPILVHHQTIYVCNSTPKLSQISQNFASLC